MLFNFCVINRIFSSSARILNIWIKFRDRGLKQQINEKKRAPSEPLRIARNALLPRSLSATDIAWDLVDPLKLRMLYKFIQKKEENNHVSSQNTNSTLFCRPLYIPVAAGEHERQARPSATSQLQRAPRPGQGPGTPSESRCSSSTASCTSPSGWWLSARWSLYLAVTCCPRRFGHWPLTVVFLGDGPCDQLTMAGN